MICRKDFIGRESGKCWLIFHEWITQNQPWHKVSGKRYAFSIVCTPYSQIDPGDYKDGESLSWHIAARKVYKYICKQNENDNDIKNIDWIFKTVFSIWFSVKSIRRCFRSCQWYGGFTIIKRRHIICYSYERR